MKSRRGKAKPQGTATPKVKSPKIKQKQKVKVKQTINDVENVKIKQPQVLLQRLSNRKAVKATTEKKQVNTGSTPKLTPDKTVSTTTNKRALRALNKDKPKDAELVLILERLDANVLKKGSPEKSNVTQIKKKDVKPTVRPETRSRKTTLENKVPIRTRSKSNPEEVNVKSLRNKTVEVSATKKLAQKDTKRNLKSQTEKALKQVDPEKVPAICKYKEQESSQSTKGIKHSDEDVDRKVQTRRVAKTREVQTAKLPLLKRSTNVNLHKTIQTKRLAKTKTLTESTANDNSTIKKQLKNIVESKETEKAQHDPTSAKVQTRRGRKTVEENKKHEPLVQNLKQNVIAVQGILKNPIKIIPKEVKKIAKETKDIPFEVPLQNKRLSIFKKDLRQRKLVFYKDPETPRPETQTSKVAVENPGKSRLFLKPLPDLHKKPKNTEDVYAFDESTTDSEKSHKLKNKDDTFTVKAKKAKKVPAPKSKAPENFFVTKKIRKAPMSKKIRGNYKSTVNSILKDIKQKINKRRSDETQQKQTENVNSPKKIQIIDHVVSNNNNVETRPNLKEQSLILGKKISATLESIRTNKANASNNIIDQVTEQENDIEMGQSLQDNLEPDDGCFGFDRDSPEDVSINMTTSSVSTNSSTGISQRQNLNKSWRFCPSNISRNPHFITLKSSALPAMNQDIILDHTFDDKLGPKSMSTPQKNASPVQKSILDYVTVESGQIEKENQDCSGRVSIYNVHELSPLKKTKLSGDKATNLTNVTRSILGEISPNVVPPQSTPHVTRSTNVAEINSSLSPIKTNPEKPRETLFGFDKSSEVVVDPVFPPLPETMPFRIPVNVYKKVKKAVPVTEVAPQVVPEEPPEEDVELPTEDKGDVTVVGIFEDFEKSDESFRNYEIKKSKKRKNVNDAEDESPRKRKKKITPEEKEFNEWAKKINAEFAEIDQTVLEVE